MSSFWSRPLEEREDVTWGQEIRYCNHRGAVGLSDTVFLQNLQRARANLWAFSVTWALSAPNKWLRSINFNCLLWTKGFIGICSCSFAASQRAVEHRANDPASGVLVWSFEIDHMGGEVREKGETRALHRSPEPEEEGGGQARRRRWHYSDVWSISDNSQWYCS